ncbi:NUDIX domain-containing protein [Phenylobacterium deserti]|uniref:NUDIX hydrolase n=1 Tax=Phenylobacterium deserti TaxID=1914756 RepID=A0A328APA1_9CAUL|nr:NUDIX domain-containing protein [Phenylobacterium deserti]RAK56823.1 NUDIX hydrolase [Phenylobacterium deserti]
MAPPVSAGILVWRRGTAGAEFLLAHPGGPFWRGKDEAAWSVPKGLVDEGEDPLAAALREFTEELGQTVSGEFVELSACRTPGGKIVRCWLVEGDLDVSRIVSNTVEVEWPRRSGRILRFPEVDQAAYFDAEAALVRIHKGQRPIIVEAIRRLAAPGG